MGSGWWEDQMKDAWESASQIFHFWSFLAIFAHDYTTNASKYASQCRHRQDSSHMVPGRLNGQRNRELAGQKHGKSIIPTSTGKVQQASHWGGTWGQWQTILCHIQQIGSHYSLKKTGKSADMFLLGCKQAVLWYQECKTCSIKGRTRQGQEASE